MLSLYQYFADIALRMVEGTHPPPKGMKFPQVGDVSEQQLLLMQAVRDHYIQELEFLPGKSNMEECQKQFESLYAAGVFKIYADTRPRTLETQMDLFVWDGVEYVPVQDAVDMYLCYEYDRTLL